MSRKTISGGSLLFAAIAGCGADAGPQSQPPTISRPPITIERPAEPARVPVAQASLDPGAAEVSWETDRDRAFARFLQTKSAGMIRKAAVGIEEHGQLRVEISKAVAPDDTLELTKSLMAGARKDFPDRAITLSLYDPQGAPILKAHHRPGHGVHYQIAHGDGTPAIGPGVEPTRKPETRTSNPGSGNSPLIQSGTTPEDRKFATWAEEHGRAYLRYVQADLQRNGRLWFGVTRDVKPADVPQLTKSLLQGAQKEFPRRDLVATVFDPEGERIGKAHLAADGQVRWEH